MGRKAEFRHNPYHDPATGRFTSGGGGGSFYKPGGNLNGKDKFRMYANGGGLTNSQNGGTIKQPTNPDEVSALGRNYFKNGFSADNLKRHWGGSSDHSKEYPNLSSAQQYNSYAIQILSSEADGKNILGYKMADGTVCRYKVSTNDYVKGNPIYDDIYTCFKPSNKSAYFHKKKREDGGIVK